MNRHERRRAEREGQKIPQVMAKISSEEYQKTLEEVQYKATREAVQVMTATMAMALNSEYGFGTERIQRTINRMRLQFECIIAKTLEPQDLIDWCSEKGVELI